MKDKPPRGFIGNRKNRDLLPISPDSGLEIMLRTLQKSNRHLAYALSLVALVLAAGVPIAEAVWHYSDREEQKRQDDRENKRRAVEVTLALETHWERTFTEKTRRLLGRFTAVLEKLEALPSPTRLEKFCAAMAQEKNQKGFEPDPTLAADLEDLFGTTGTAVEEGDGKPPRRNSPAWPEYVGLQISHYRMVLLTTLNTCEEVAVMRWVVNTQPTQEIIDSKYWGNIVKRVGTLRPFIGIYNYYTYRKPSKYKAWHILLREVDNSEKELHIEIDTPAWRDRWSDWAPPSERQHTG